jgi:hypothetical protein
LSLRQGDLPATALWAKIATAAAALARLIHSYFSLWCTHDTHQFALGTPSTTRHTSSLWNRLLLLLALAHQSRPSPKTGSPPGGLIASLSAVEEA